MPCVLTVTTLLLALLVKVVLSESPCTPKVAGCTCSGAPDGIITCVGISSLPLLPDGINKVFCRDCSLGPELNKEAIPASYSPVVSLWLHNSQIESLANDTFHVMSKLKHLNLQTNKLKTFPVRAFNGLEHLEWLEVNNNLLEVLPSKIFINTTALNTVDFSHNNNVKLPANLFDGLPIVTLSLAEVGLTEVPKDLLRNIGTSLITLSLNSNMLKSLKKDAFKDLLEVQNLKLDSCGIENIEDGAFNGLNNLQKLNLGYNRLTSLDTKVFHNLHDTLVDLKIENNQLTTLDSDIINWDNVNAVLLGHNPWHCDCSLKWMKRLDIANLEVIHENVTCATPDEYAGRSLQNVTEEMLCDCLTCGGGKSAVALAVAIPILIICICLIAYYLYRIMQNRRKRAMKRSGYNYSSVYKDTVEPTRAAAGPIHTRAHSKNEYY